MLMGCRQETKLIGGTVKRQYADYFGGEIDEIRISNIALEPDEPPPTSPFVPHDPTLGLWHFDDLQTPPGIDINAKKVIVDSNIRFDRNHMEPINVVFVDSTIPNPLTPTPTLIPSATPTPTSMPAPLGYSKVFVTSADYDGNLGGLDGADAKCQERANAANLGGIWKAWLSTNSIPATSRLIHYSTPYKLINGAVIASNWNDLTDRTLQNFINITELGTPFSTSVWTGTKYDGTSSGFNCSDWTRNVGHDYGTIGASYLTNEKWSDEGSTDQFCTIKNRLYCFEQPTPTPTLAPNLCTVCSADINKDKVVNIQDTAVINSCLNKAISDTCVNADIDKNGKIDIVDLNCAFKNFLKICPR